MKIAQVCPHYYPYIGGVQSCVKEISERLVKKGLSIEVLTTDRSGMLSAEEKMNGVQIRRFKSWEGIGRTTTPGAYYFSRGLESFLLQHSRDYDVVHAHMYTGLPALYAARAKGGNRFVLSPHYHQKSQTLFANMMRIPWKLVAKRMYEVADAILCVSEHERSLVVRDFGIEGTKVSVVRLGVNMDEFRRITKWRRNRQTILYVGRLVRYKGVEYLIRVLTRLDSRMRLEISGNGPDKERLVRLANMLHVQNRVTFDTPSRDELLRKYAEAAVFVLLSRYEAFSLSVAEALASGTPCIVANSSALREWVDDRNCFGIDYPIDLDRLARLICGVIGTRVEGVKLDDWDRVAERLCTVYLDLEGRPHRSLDQHSQG